MWLGDVFDALPTERVEDDRQPGSDLITDRAGEANSPGLGQRLQPGGNINAVTKEVRALDDYVPQMDADAESHLLTFGAVRVLFRDRLLGCDGALDRVDRTCEIRHQAVPGGIEYSTAMGGDQSIENRPVRLKRAQRADLVQPHQAAVLGNIGGKDHRELSFDDLDVCHLAPPQGHLCRIKPFED